jgi:hypothetical protein
MSRRNNVTEPAYGQIKLKCPRGHEVGAILVQPRRPIGGRKALYRLGAVLKAPEIEELESPEENFVHEGRMEWGGQSVPTARFAGAPTGHSGRRSNRRSPNSRTRQS